MKLTLSRFCHNSHGPSTNTSLDSISLLKMNQLKMPNLIMHLSGFKYITSPSIVWTKPMLRLLDNPWVRLNRLMPPRVVNVVVDVLEFELILTYANPSLRANLWTWETRTHFGFHSNMNRCPYSVIVWLIKPRWKGLQKLGLIVAALWIRTKNNMVLSYEPTSPTSNSHKLWIVRPPNPHSLLQNTIPHPHHIQDFHPHQPKTLITRHRHRYQSPPWLLHHFKNQWLRIRKYFPALIFSIHIS